MVLRIILNHLSAVTLFGCANACGVIDALVDLDLLNDNYHDLDIHYFTKSRLVGNSCGWVSIRMRTDSLFSLAFYVNFVGVRMGVKIIIKSRA